METQKVLIGLHTGSGSASAAFMLAKKGQMPQVVKWPHNCTTVPLLLSSGDNQSSFKWGKEASVNDHYEASFSLFAAEAWSRTPKEQTLIDRICSNLHQRRGKFCYHSPSNVFQAPESSLNAFKAFIQAMKTYLEDEIKNAYGKESLNMELRICATVPPYYDDLQRQGFKSLLIDALGTDVSPRPSVVVIEQYEACVSCFEAEEGVTCEVGDQLVVCNIEEELTSLICLEASTICPKATWKATDFLRCGLFGSSRIGDLYQKHVYGKLRNEVALDTLNGVSGSELLSQVKKAMNAFLDTIHEQRADCPKSISIRVNTATGKQNILLSISEDAIKDEIFRPLLDQIYGLFPDFEETSRCRFLLFSGGLSECPYLHSYMRDRLENRVQILDTFDESTYACRGSVFKLNGNDHVTHSPLRLFDCDLEIPPTAKLSHLSSLKDVQRELLDQVQRHEDYKNLLAIYELICFDLFSREGYGSSDTKSAVLRLESLYTEMGYEDRAASICKDFSEGYIREQIHRPDLEVVSKPLILDAYHFREWPGNLGRADIHHPLHLATVLDDEDAVRIVLRGGADINLRTNTTHSASNADGIGYTALYLAICRGHDHIVQLLLDKGANVNAGPPLYFTALHAAAEWGNEEVVRALLQRGADIDAKYQGHPDCGYTALHVAAEQGHEHIVHVLLQEGVDPNAACEHIGELRFPALYFAVLKGHEKVVYLLLNGGADAMARFGWGQTALSVALDKGHRSVAHLLRKFSFHSAARDGNVAAVREALVAGVDVNQTWEQQSALFAAVSSDQEAVVRFLLDNQANANTSVQGQSALHVASDLGNMPIVELLLCNGAETDVVNSQGCTPLAIAAMSGHEDIGQLLIQYGAKVAKGMESLPRGSSAVGRLTRWAVIGQANDISPASETPPDDLPSAIFKAVEAGGERKVENLIRLGAPVNNRYTAGKTLVHLATSKGYLQVLRVLLENGANVNGKDDCLQTALHYVAQHPEWSHAVPVAGLLIRKGAHDSITDYRGLTPYDIAKASGNAALLGMMPSCEEPYPDSQSAFNLAEANGWTKTVQSLKEHSEGKLASKSLPTNRSPKTPKERDLTAKDALSHAWVEFDEFDELPSATLSAEMQRSTPTTKEKIPFQEYPITEASARWSTATVTTLKPNVLVNPASTGKAPNILQPVQNTISILPDGETLASRSDDRIVRPGTLTGAARYTLKGHSDEVMAVAFSPDGKTLASASFDTTIRLWNSTTGAALYKLEGHSNIVRAVLFSPDGKTLASASLDKTVRLWDSTTGAALCTLEGHSDKIEAMAFSPDGKTLASTSLDKIVRLWDSTIRVARYTLEGHSDWVMAVAFSPDGKTLTSASDDMTVRLWNSATGAARYTLRGHLHWVRAVAFSPDGKTLASGSCDKTVRLWDSTTGAALRTLKGHSLWVMAVVFSQDGKTLASGSLDKTVRLWDSTTGAARYTLEGHSHWVMAVAFSPDGKTLASGSGDYTVRLWDSTTGAALRTLKGHSSIVRAVAFSLDGKTLASGSRDHTVRLWDLTMSATCRTLEGHSDKVEAVAFSPDGKTLVSGSLDKTVRLWDSTTGAARHTLEGHLNRVWARGILARQSGSATRRQERTGKIL